MAHIFRTTNRIVPENSLNLLVAPALHSCKLIAPGSSRRFPDKNPEERTITEMNTEHDSLAKRGHALEEAFFRNVDAQLLEKLKAETNTASGREDLVRKTGMTDQALIDELVSQGVTAEGVMALRVIPLVLVAWADREVTEDERKAVLEEAHKMGIEEDHVPHLLLEQWLRIRPAPELGDAWKRYTVELLDKMKESERQAYLRELKREMTTVAKASGGILGFGKISQSESQLMDLLLEPLQ